MNYTDPQTQTCIIGVICHHCSDTIPAGESYIHIPFVGNFHEGCPKEVRPIPKDHPNYCPNDYHGEGG